jgi:SAM-dependent methyltransferase
MALQESLEIAQSELVESEKRSSTVETLGEREQFRDNYWRKTDPISEERLLWRTQTFRHLVHLLPGQRILELGCGQGQLTQKLVDVSRGENPITAVSFSNNAKRPSDIPEDVEFVPLHDLPSTLATRRFDLILAMDLLDVPNNTWLLRHIRDLLEPGGQVVFYERNPWNPVRKLRHSLAKLFGRKEPQGLLNRQNLYELLSEIGFIRVFAIYNDFVYPRLSRRFMWLLRNLSVVLEIMPGVQTLAGSILIHAQKPPLNAPRPVVSLFAHESLRNAVSVIIPCKNEEMNIGPLVTQLLGYYGEYIHEIIPIDGNSSDGTAAEMRRLAAKHSFIKPIFRTPPNGIGLALADGFAAASGRYVMTMDCDIRQLLPEMRDMFDAAAEGYDVVFASRFSRRSVLLNYPWQKIVANRAFHVLARLLLGHKFRDVTNNLKLMRREVVENFQIAQTGFAACAETGLQPVMMGYSYHETPISWINRTPDMGVSSFNLTEQGGGYRQVLFSSWRRRREFARRGRKNQIREPQQ